MSDTTMRPLTRDDTTVLYDAIFVDGDPDPERFLFKDGSPPQTTEQTGEFLKWLMDGAAEGALQPFLLVDEEDECVGLAWITGGDGGEPPEISVLVGPRSRGKGHARRGIAQLVRIALDYGAGSVEAVVHSGNEPVIRILESSGFEVASGEHPITCEQTWRKLAEGDV